MMGMHEPQKEMFSYQVDLDKRVRSDHPLRRISEVVDWNFIRGEVLADQRPVASRQVHADDSDLFLAPQARHVRVGPGLIQKDQRMWVE